MKNWNLMFIAGNPNIFSKVRSPVSHPVKRSVALSDANSLSPEWRVWVEHKDTGKRIFESEAEKKWEEKV